MKNSPDPAVHRARERQFIEHVERLLGDERLRVDTTKGRRPMTAFSQSVAKTDRSVELKRMMTDAGRPDRELEAAMPLGETIEIELRQSKMLLMKESVGRLKCLCLSPTRALLKDEPIEPMSRSEIERALGPTPPGAATVPSTVVVLSTSGFTFEAHELADRRADRTLILVESNDAGGYSVYGPVETKSLNDLFDPEAEDQKRRRVHEVVEALHVDLAGSGIATDKVAAATQLPLQLIEAELKSYAKQNAGLVAKRLEGRIVLFREGSVPAASAASSASSRGGSDMPMIDRIKSLFARKGETEKKIAFLSERRALLGQQRDRAYDDIATLEKKDEAMRRLFRETNADVAKRRITSQLVQLRKDLDRRHQLISVLNQQIDVVSTHLHTLELVQQGQTAQLPDSDEMATDAARAEEMLATLEANHELAVSVGGVTTAGMSAEEQAMFEELQREAAGGASAAAASRSASTPPARERPASDAPARTEPRRSEPEAG
jgi:hypothetical protein